MHFFKKTTYDDIIYNVFLKQLCSPYLFFSIQTNLTCQVDPLKKMKLFSQASFQQGTVNNKHMS